MTDRKTIVGVILVGVGLFVLLVGVIIGIWASSHSPNIGFMDVLRDPNNYIIKQPYYNIILLIAWGAGLLGTALAILGGILFVLSLSKK